MKGYSRSHTEEKETYKEYMIRKQAGWEKRLEEIIIEIKDSSLKPSDKRIVLRSLAQSLIKNQK